MKTQIDERDMWQIFKIWVNYVKTIYYATKLHGAIWNIGTAYKTHEKNIDCGHPNTFLYITMILFYAGQAFFCWGR